ncbi:hypothetical protein VTN77DRAFT_2374 [Rasamsonia byssochlamydoides]|uniref:uncharacterized protein n=1 Tax=Rasamsonia byssochlamydoides TaxID=89139 RepID=UPI0037448EC7
MTNTTPLTGLCLGHQPPLNLYLADPPASEGFAKAPYFRRSATGLSDLQVESNGEVPASSHFMCFRPFAGAINPLSYNLSSAEDFPDSAENACIDALESHDTPNRLQSIQQPKGLTGQDMAQVTGPYHNLPSIASPAHAETSYSPSSEGQNWNRINKGSQSRSVVLVKVLARSLSHVSATDAEICGANGKAAITRVSLIELQT